MGQVPRDGPRPDATRPAVGARGVGRRASAFIVHEDDDEDEDGIPNRHIPCRGVLVPMPRRILWQTAAMLLLFSVLACSDPVVPPQAELTPEELTPDPVTHPDVVAAAQEPTTPPIGSIGGEPILPDIVVVGGISAAKVEASMAEHTSDILGCQKAGLEQNPVMKGKVLVKFSIDKEGKVGSNRVVSTSLRHPATETCLTELVAQISFPALDRGRIAIVTYPFEFPMEGPG